MHARIPGDMHEDKQGRPGTLPAQPARPPAQGGAQRGREGRQLTPKRLASSRSPSTPSASSRWHPRRSWPCSAPGLPLHGSVLRWRGAVWALCVARALGYSPTKLRGLWARRPKPKNESSRTDGDADHGDALTQNPSRHASSRECSAVSQPGRPAGCVRTAAGVRDRGLGRRSG